MFKFMKCVAGYSY